jgi:transposase
MQVKSEPVGDLCLINRLIDDTGLVERIDTFFPMHHLWEGISMGKTLKSMLLYILSENNHSLYSIESWAAQRQEVLRWLLDEPDFVASHLSDDRLGRMLDTFSQRGDDWKSFQRTHNEFLIRMYDLRKDQSDVGLETVRIDSTTAQSYRSEAGLFLRGHNAQGLSVPQLKVMLLAMDIGNFPVAANVVEGNRADDQLYVSVLQTAWERGLPKQGLLIVGDSKLCNAPNTSFIAQSGNYYLGPLSLKQYSSEQRLEALLWMRRQSTPIPTVSRLAAGAKQAEPIAQCFELPERVILDDDGREHTQRLIAVCSVQRRTQMLAKLQERVDEASAQVEERFIVKQGRKTLNTREMAQDAVDRILHKYKVAHLFDLHIEPPGQPKSPCTITLTLRQQAYEQEQFLAGWRIMATNASAENLSAQDAVLCYWEEYRIEQQFHLLLNKCGGLAPVYLRKEDRILALIQILILALQYSNLWQHNLRLQLRQQEQSYLTEVVPGNPGMKVHRPTTKLVLSAFKNVQIIFVDLPDGQHFAQVQGLHKNLLRILRLLGLSEEIYLHPSCQRT